MLRMDSKKGFSRKPALSALPDPISYKMKDSSVKISAPKLPQPAPLNCIELYIS